MTLFKTFILKRKKNISGEEIRAKLNEKNPWLFPTYGHADPPPPPSEVVETLWKVRSVLIFPPGKFSVIFHLRAKLKVCIPCNDGWVEWPGHALTKLDFPFLSHWMGYDRGDSFPFDFEPNRKKNCHHNHIPFNLEGNRNLLFSMYSVNWEKYIPISFQINYVVIIIIYNYYYYYIVIIPTTLERCTLYTFPVLLG